MSERDRELIEQSHAALERSARELDPETLTRLAQARARALERAGRRTHPRIWLLGGGLASASAAALAWLLLSPSVEPGPALVVEDLELLSSTESLELLQDLDFYEWLESDESIS